MITLAVIGVVAALTIPTVVHKYQQKVFYTGFMKMYNTITNAIELSIADNGISYVWAFDKSNPNQLLDTYILPYLKVTNTYDANSDVFSSYEVKRLGSSELFEDGQVSDMLSNNGATFKAIQLSDGSLIFPKPFFGNDKFYGLDFYFDTNGFKGPNEYGRDIFMISFEQDDIFIDDEYEIEGESSSSSSNNSGPVGSNCEPGSNNEENGTGCAVRLIQEGKMNY